MVMPIKTAWELVDALKLGAADYVVKPFDKEPVEQALNGVIAG